MPFEVTMARLSYGGDIFSPIRSDVSFNDSNLKGENSGRGSISEDLLEVPSVESSQSFSSTDGLELSERRRKNLPLEEVALHRKNKKVESKSKKSDKPVPNSNLVLITPCARVENINSELPIKELPRKSRRLQKNEDGISKKGTDSKDWNSQYSNKKSKKKSNDSVTSKFITIRGGESKKTEQMANRTKSCSADIITTPSEMLEEKENGVCLENSNKSSVHVGSDNYKKREMTISVKSNSAMPSNQTILHSQLNETINVAELKTSSNTDNSELENMALMEKINAIEPSSNMDNSELEKMAQKEKINVAELKTASNIDNSKLKNMTQKDLYSGATLPNDPTQIQANIIEKLITDTVNSEFDVIRQQLYLQQISLLKVLNQTRDEFENRYSRNTENLYKIIEGLLEENRQLRSAIIAQR